MQYDRNVVVGPNVKIAFYDLLYDLLSEGQEWHRLELDRAALSDVLYDSDRTTLSLVGAPGDTTLRQPLVICTLVPKAASKRSFKISRLS